MSYQHHNRGGPPYLVQETSTWAVVSLISGIASYLIIPVIGSFVAVITGYIGKKQIREGQGRYTGDSMATIGIVLGWIQIALGVVGLCLGLLAFLGVITLPLCFIPFLNGF